MTPSTHEAPTLEPRQQQAILAVTLVIAAIFFLNGLWLERAFRASPVLFWVLDVCQFVALPLVCAIVLGSYGVSPAAYGFRSFGGELSALAVLGLCGFVTFLYWLFYEPVHDLALRYLAQYAGTFSYGEALPASGLYRGVAVVYLALSAAFVEEAVFRSLPWLYLSARYPHRRFVAAYVAVTSLAFAAIHWEQGPAGVIAALAVGLIGAWLYSRVVNVWPFVVAHFLTDVGVFGQAS